jgi:hypothetical protein
MTAIDATAVPERGPGPELSRPIVHWLVLAGIVAGGAFLRLVDINDQGLWGDEALTIPLAHWPAWEMLMLPTDPTPPLYYLLHKILLTADASAGMVRSIAFVCGLASIGLMYLLGRLALGARAGLLAAAMLAAWPQHIDYSQEARAYALLFLLTLASATSLLWWWRLSSSPEPGSDRRRMLALLLFSLTTALSFYAHLVSVFWILLALDIFRTLSQTSVPPRPRETALALGLMAALAVPGLIRFYRQFTSPTNFNWLQQASPADFASSTLQMLLPLRSPAGTLFQESWAVWPAVIALAALGLWLLLKVRAGAFARRDRAVVYVTLAFLALPLLVWLAGYVIRPIFMERTILFAIPGAILALLAALRAVRNPALHTTAGICAVLALLGSTLAQGTMRPKEDWRGVYAFLKRQVRPGDTILFCAWQYPSLRHAADRPLPAPVVNWYGGLPILVEERLGGRADWDQLFYRSHVRPVALRTGDLPFGERSASLRPGSRLWLVESECSPEARSAMAYWLPAETRWRPAWTSPPRPAATITVAQSRVGAPAVVKLLAPPEMQSPSAQSSR